MMHFWNRLSTFTRLLAVLVVVAALAGSYARLRFKPQQAALREVERATLDIRREVRDARHRVDRLEREAELARRWSDYARVLEAQSTGRSLRDVLATCGTEDGPRVEVASASFERGEGTTGIGVQLRVRGEYDALIELLGELDRTFPPIEITRTSLGRVEDSDTASATSVIAELEGVIHETR